MTHGASQIIQKRVSVIQYGFSRVRRSVALAAGQPAVGGREADEAVCLSPASYVEPPARPARSSRVATSCVKA